MGVEEFQQRQSEQLQQQALKGDWQIARLRGDTEFMPSGNSGGTGLLGFLGGGVVLVLALVGAYQVGLLSYFEGAKAPASAPGSSTMTLRDGRDYAVADGRLQEATARSDVPEFEVAPAGLKLWAGTQALLLPAAANGDLATCLHPPRGARVVRYAWSRTVPWTALTEGRSLCLLPEESSVSLLTVKAAAEAESTVVTMTWPCANGRPSAGRC